MNIDSVFGVIPCRAGSKRLPGKNLKQLAGMSLLERTIRQAKKALPVSFVSTEDSKISLESLRLGMQVLWRPESVATDEATSEDVLEHAVNTHIHLGFDWFCLLQVTSPLRSVEDILNCLAIADKHNKPVVSVHEGKRNGAVYVGKVMSLKENYFKDAILYEMPYERSIDIDTVEDFNEAERLLLERECTDCRKL